MSDIQKLTDIDLTELQIGETLTIYRGSSAFLTGPGAAGYVGDATVTNVTKKKATIFLRLPENRGLRAYRLRFKDGRICRIPNGEMTMLYVHARGGRPTVTAYFTDAEYELVRSLLQEEIIAKDGGQLPSMRRSRHARSALDRMQFHDSLRNKA